MASIRFLHASLAPQAACGLLWVQKGQKVVSFQHLFTKPCKLHVSYQVAHASGNCLLPVFVPEPALSQVNTDTEGAGIKKN